MGTRLTLRLLGPPEVRLGGEPALGFASDKVRALLFYLAVEAGRPHRRELLAGLLWPDYPERSARTNLSNALSNLRTVLRDRQASPPCLLVSRETIQFNLESDHEVDATAFDRLVGGRGWEAAVSLYRGSFLEGFSVGDSPPFEQWALVERERAQREMLSAVEGLAAECEGRGDYARAAELARRQLAIEPWQERAHRQLMGILARSGQRNAALEQYKACWAVLARELGIEPEVETQRLYGAIRDGSLGAGSAVLPTSPDMPLPMLPLLGREGELAEIEACLSEPDSRLLTLVGPGGSGKTHLALEAAFRQGDAYGDGAVVVGLAAVQAVDAVVPAIAQAAGLSLQPELPARRQLLDYMREKGMLLVLDNLEHLVVGPPSAQGTLARLLLDILQTAPRVRILATSRVRLNLYGEHLLHVGGLPTPEPDDDQATLASYPAIQLFLSTARRVRAAYAPGGEGLRAIAGLCRLLSGMPLAIVLAGSWMEVLGPAQILEQVRRHYDFLEVEWQDLPPRQRSVRAVLDHSWGLLTEREQQLFPGLSVFRGGFTAAAGEQVAGVSLRDLMRLSGKSFLVRLPSGRYEMHELLRQYAEGKLAQVAGVARERHCAYYLAVAERCGEELKGPRQRAALEELEVEAENLRVAWEWGAAQGGIARLGRAVDGLCRLFERRGRCEEGAALCGAAVERLGGAAGDEGRRVWARLLAWQGAFERMAGRMERADRLAEQSLGVLEQVVGEARSERAFALRVRGEAAFRLGQRRRAEELYQQSLALYQALDDPWNSARLLCDLGEVAFQMGQTEDARRWLEASLQLRRAISDRTGAADTLLMLAGRAAAMGDLARGERWAREAMRIHREMADEAGLARGSFTLACVLGFSGRYREAQPLLEDAARFAGRLGQRAELASAQRILYWAQMNLGNYEQARGLLAASKAFYQESGDMEGMAYHHLDQAHFALLAARDTGSRADYEAAYRCAEQSLIAFREVEHNDEGLAWSHLGYVAHCLGRHAEARRHLREALRSARGARALQTTVVALAHLAAILADGEPERAVELYALATRHPYVGNSRLWEDLLGSRVAAAAARLPAPVVEAAQARGWEGDWVAATEDWLRELGADQTGSGKGRDG